MPEAVQFKSGDLTLEAILYHPPDMTMTTVVVICHPHPQRAGDMHNNVVMAIVHCATAAGLGALTFNFRGVGRSEGTHDEGLGEQDDVRAAIDYAASLEGVEHVALAGYSFGAGVASMVADSTVEAVALVAPPAARLAEAEALRSYPGPVFLIAGEQDHVASTESMLAVARARTADTEVQPIPGVDHFWRGAEPELREQLKVFLVARLVSAVD